MGQFTSFCPECNARIHWFIDAPKNFFCDCGRKVSEKEIEDSWHDYYSEDRRMRSKMIVFSMHRSEALELGLLVCKCGHKTDDHIGYYKNCTECNCKEYKEIAPMGKIVNEDLCRFCECTISHYDGCQCERDD